MQSYSSQRNTTIADFQQIQVSTTLSKSSKWKVIEKAFPAPQLWTSTPKNHPTRYCIYTGGLIHQETPDTSSFQWAEAPQRFCTPSQRGCRSRLTICQLNQFITNSEAAMLSKHWCWIHWDLWLFSCEENSMRSQRPLRDWEGVSGDLYYSNNFLSVVKKVWLLWLSIGLIFR